MLCRPRGPLVSIYFLRAFLKIPVGSGKGEQRIYLTPSDWQHRVFIRAASPWQPHGRAVEGVGGTIVPAIVCSGMQAQGNGTGTGTKWHMAQAAV